MSEGPPPRIPIALNTKSRFWNLSCRLFLASFPWLCVLCLDLVILFWLIYCMDFSLPSGNPGRRHWCIDLANHENKPQSTPPEATQTFTNHRIDQAAAPPPPCSLWMSPGTSRPLLPVPLLVLPYSSPDSNSLGNSGGNASALPSSPDEHVSAFRVYFYFSVFRVPEKSTRNIKERWKTRNHAVVTVCLTMACFWGWMDAFFWNRCRGVPLSELSV